MGRQAWILVSIAVAAGGAAAYFNSSPRPVAVSDAADRVPAASASRAPDLTARTATMRSRAAAQDPDSLRREMRESGPPHVADLMDELKLRKDDYRALADRFDAARARHAVVAAKDPKDPEVARLDAEMDSLLEEMRATSKDVARVTGEAIDAYASAKMAELHVTR